MMGMVVSSRVASASVYARELAMDGSGDAGVAGVADISMAVPDGTHHRLVENEK